MGCLIVFIIIAFSFVFAPHDKIADKANDDKIMAWVMAQSFVEDRLKSPSTAKFPQHSDETVVPLGNGQFLVSGYVDAQNSFGATVRSDFTCTLQQNGENWKLLDISMTQR